MHRNHKLIEETVDFKTMGFCLEEGFEIEADADEAEVNEFSDPLDILIAYEEASMRATRMTARNEPRGLGVFKRSKI